MSLTIFDWLWPIAVVVMLKSIADIYLKHRRYFVLGRKLPGPRPLPLVGNILLFLGDASNVLKKLGQIAGTQDLTALWIGPKLAVIVNSPVYAEKFFNDPNLLDHSEHYKFIKRVLRNGIFTSEGDEWKKARKLIAPTFHMTTLRQFLKTFHQSSQELVNQMRGEIGKATFGVRPYINQCTLKIIFGAAMQTEVKPEESELFNEAMEVVEKLLKLLQDRAYKIWLHNDLIYSYSSAGRTFDAMTAGVKSLLARKVYVSREDVIRRTDESGLGDKVFIRRLVDQYDFNDLIDQITNITVAGYETTSSVLSCLFVMLAAHPDIQEKVYREVCEVRQGCESPHLDTKDVDKLKYLELVIKETLRMFPPAPVIARKAAGDIVMGKHIIPKDATVAINIYHMQRDPVSYQQPDKFDPDRFSPENDSKRHPYSFVPFASGPRMCIGFKFAMLSMKVIASTILLNYRLECDYKMEDIEVQVNLLLSLKNGYHLRIKNR